MTDEIRQDPSKTLVPYWLTDAVCEVPYGSYPCNMPYEYSSDEAHLAEWIKSEKDQATLDAFLAKYIYSTRDFSDAQQHGRDHGGVPAGDRGLHVPGRCAD